ncbi:hypothetical protein [Enorma massiliensis]|uniref:hypothetical protein n=1 Tax=Enorma massiliensis TaxID=1472761 RepID=UPI00320810C5
MERYYAGESPAAIFRETGLDPSLIGYKRIERSIARWRHPGNSAPAGVESSHVAADHRAVRQENRVLRSKVAALEGLVKLANARSNAVVRKGRRFELIERVRESVPDFSVSVACKTLGVSEGGYYRWRSTKE